MAYRLFETGAKTSNRIMFKDGCNCEKLTLLKIAENGGD